MKNPMPVAATEIVDQKAPLFPTPDTFHIPLTPSQAARAAQFRTMFKSIEAEKDEQGRREAAQEFQERLKRFGGQEATLPANPFIHLAESLAKGPQEPQEAPPSPVQAQTPKRGYRKAQGPVQRPPAPEVPPLADLLDLEALRCKRGRGAGGAGAGQLAELLDEVARHTLKARRYAALPHQITMHLPQELLAAALDVNPVTIWRWTQQLEATGYLQAREHYTTTTTQSGPRTVVDGTLYAVRLRPGHIAHLHHDDLAHQYRDLDADRAAGRTAFSALSALGVKVGKNYKVVKMQGSKEAIRVNIRNILYTWVVTPGDIYSNPVNLIDPCIFQDDPPLQTAEAVSAGLQGVSEALSTIETADSTSRPRVVNELACRIAHALNDTRSVPGWAGVLWDAYEMGRVQVLAAQLNRAVADFAEYPDIRNPAAWLMARVATKNRGADFPFAAD